MQPIRVDFYLLEEEGSAALALLACRLLEKAYAEGHKIFVVCSNQIEAEKLDALLWSFKAEAFIPHQLLTATLSEEVPIAIGGDWAPDLFHGNFHEILFNLSPEVPCFYRKFKRVIELVENSDTAKELSRMHYRQYRKDLCDLYTHPLV